jgi:hypothetical protein
LQGISYSVTREKAPVYTMGSADPRAYARNKRGIAGNLIWINFDRDSLLALVEQAGGKFVADVDEIRPSFVGNDQIDPSSQAIFATSLTRTSGPSVGATIDTFNQLGQTGVNDFAAPVTPWYHDQILPFDITPKLGNSPAPTGLPPFQPTATNRIYMAGRALSQAAWIDLSCWQKRSAWMVSVEFPRFRSTGCGKRLEQCLWGAEIGLLRAESDTELLWESLVAMAASDRFPLLGRGT